MSRKSYVDEGLLPGERVLHRAHLHWSIFVRFSALLTLFLGPLIRRKTFEAAVTNRRVIAKSGLFARHTLELNLTRVESVAIEQSFWGRLFGVGTVVVIGTGGTRERLPQLADPVGFRRAVNMGIDESPRVEEGAPGGTKPPAP